MNGIFTANRTFDRSLSGGAVVRLRGAAPMAGVPGRSLPVGGET